ncbi:hypothetical protein [Haloarcula pellucida]|uniref:Uncharacterized protein n=1 Tax=Haloarcula pellucida TaxID=1427151 RepID=A0A830GLW6_9EURY|nr:hypothetical protein [Halomicroarcula pellucida]MBX0348646.1 hypothetical protein [Halomicroarcula pellucida]GGN92442.1 hypothetical protein GCM10009030_16640 [Halomicroarcula pellucida]
MFEADPLTMAAFANDAVRMAMQAGPPTDLPAQVPDFVGDVLGEAGSSAGEAKDGFGETISGLTPGGSEAAEGAAAANATDASEAAADAAGT